MKKSYLLLVIGLLAAFTVSAFAGTAALLPSENYVGKVGGPTTIISPTITVSTSPAYTANDVVGGKLTLTDALRVSGGTGILQSLCIIDKGNQKAALEILIFDSNPSSGTYTDNGAFSWNATDGAKLIRRISVLASDYTTFGTAAIADLSTGGKVLKASGSKNLYAVIVTTGTPTYVATTDLIVRFGILQD
jgi:hypothetical protein